MAKKETLKYRVREGRRFGSYFEHGPGDVVELTEAQAGGFPDILELVKDKPEPPDPDAEEKHLQTLKVGQLTHLAEYEKLEAPKPTKKDKIIKAILEARHGPPDDDDKDKAES
jgi:hypothetical protein